MKKLLKNKKGFTLMEMLIVVAIIVILVAISVPTFSANLDEAKQATDAANLRAAKSAAQIANINGELEADTDYYYDITDGVVKELGSGTTNIGECSSHTDAYIAVDDEGNVTWSNNKKCGD